VKYHQWVIQSLFALSLNFGTAAIAASDATQPFNAAQQKELQSMFEKYLLDNPDILIKMSQKLQTQQMQYAKNMKQQALKQIPKVSKVLFHSAGSPTVGNPNGNVTLVEFFDFQCPHCKDMSTVVDGIIHKDSDLRVVHKPLPIFGENSTYAAKAALAASKQGKYNAFYEALMKASNPLTKDKALDAAKKVGLDVKQLEADIASPAIVNEINQNLQLAQELGVTGTPTYVIARSDYTPEKNNKTVFIPGSTNAENLDKMIAQVRNQS
jgi:protein-disulfide isomerase